MVCGTFFLSRFACAIEDKQSNSLIITGGYENRMDRSKRVTKYDKNGVHTDLPKLNYARTDHACGSYSNKIKQVKFHFKVKLFEQDLH